MRVPGKLKKVKPGEIVVFEKPVHFGNGDFDALCQMENEALIFFDTEYYETNGQPVFYNDRECKTALGYDLDCLEFAKKLSDVGITPRELKEHYHDFEWIASILKKDLERTLDKAAKNALSGFDFKNTEQK